MKGFMNKIRPSEGQASRASVRANDRSRGTDAQTDDVRRKIIVGDQWTCKMESLFALTAYNVNVFCLWCFPVYCFKNGGIAFLVPYFLTILLCGMPLYIMEMRLGQAGGGGLVALWHCAPLFKGIGFAGLFINFVVSVYYAAFGAWTVYYLVASFRSQLLWTTCDSSMRWVTNACSLIPPNCTDQSNFTWCPTNVSDHLHYHYGISPVSLRLVHDDFDNLTDSESVNWTSIYNESLGSIWRLPAHDYFEVEIIRATSIVGVKSEIGLDYELILCLLLICLIIFFALIRGTKSIGKACMITVSLSYMFTAAVVIRTIFSFNGAALGLTTYLFPDWVRLTEISVWGDASLLAFFTLFPTWGVVANIASHNTADHKYAEDAIISTLGSAVSNVFYGFTIAVLIGVLADTMDVSPMTFITVGPELIFIAVAQALSQLPLAPIWSSFLFFAILNIIVGTLIIMAQTVVEAFVRCHLGNQNGNRWRPLFTAIVCAGIFLLGLGQMCSVGIQVTSFLIHYCSWWNTLILALLEIVILSCIFCRFDNNCDRSKCNRFLRCGCIFWQLLAGAIVILMLIYTFWINPPISIGSSNLYEYPVWAHALGWALTSIPLGLVVVTALKTLAQADGSSVVDKLKNSLKPSMEWRKIHEINKDAPSHQKRDLGDDDIEPPTPLPRKISNNSADPAILIIEQPPPPNNSVIVLPPPPEPIRKPLRIGATEPGMKPGKINRGTQMTRDIAAQTGDEEGEGAFVEYPEHYDHPEFMGVAENGSKKHKKRKDKNKKKEKKHKKRDQSRDQDDDRPQTPDASQPQIPDVEATDAEEKYKIEKETDTS